MHPAAVQGLFTTWAQLQGALLAADAILQGCPLQLYEPPDYVVVFRCIPASRVMHEG